MLKLFNKPKGAVHDAPYIDKKKRDHIIKLLKKRFKRTATFIKDIHIMSSDSLAHQIDLIIVSGNSIVLVEIKCANSVMIMKQKGDWTSQVSIYDYEDIKIMNYLELMQTKLDDLFNTLKLNINDYKVYKAFFIPWGFDGLDIKGKLDKNSFILQGMTEEKWFENSRDLWHYVQFHEKDLNAPNGSKALINGINDYKLEVSKREVKFFRDEFNKKWLNYHKKAEKIKG